MLTRQQLTSSWSITRYTNTHYPCFSLLNLCATYPTQKGRRPLNNNRWADFLVYMVQHKARAAVRQLLTSRPLDWLKWEAICSLRCMWDQWWMKADDMGFFHANSSTSLETPWTQHTHHIYILETHWTQFSPSASHIIWANGPLLSFLILSTTVNALRATLSHLVWKSILVTKKCLSDAVNTATTVDPRFYFFLLFFNLQIKHQHQSWNSTVWHYNHVSFTYVHMAYKLWRKQPIGHTLL